MAASLGLFPEALFSSAFMADYAPSLPFAAGATTVSSNGGDFLVELDDHQYQYHPFEYSPPPTSAPVAAFFAGAGEEEEDDNDGRGVVDGKRRPVARVNRRIGFRTRSEAVEILDDGFKWRKYGKKAVKNSPNPRNYYRCSAEGCGVKKRVERDRDDRRYVVTTYDGVHNHATPSAAAAAVQYYYSPPRSSAAAGSPPAAYSAGSSLYF